MYSFIAYFGAYVIGAIPTGYWLCKYLYKFDITRYGSGNIGATNVARVLGWQYFVIVFLCDATKAYLAIMLGQMIVPSAGYVLAGAVLLGNAYSIFLGFRGGKGVATTVGMMLAFCAWPLVFGFLVCWLMLLGVTKQPFVASLTSFILMIIGNILLHEAMANTSFLVIILAWLIFRHSANLKKYLGMKSI